MVAGSTGISGRAAMWELSSSLIPWYRSILSWGQVVQAVQVEQVEQVVQVELVVQVEQVEQVELVVQVVQVVQVKQVEKVLQALQVEQVVEALQVEQAPLTWYCSSLSSAWASRSFWADRNSEIIEPTWAGDMAMHGDR